ncbi:MAG: hypothetical protein V3W44_03350, partial [Dehalococcoidales bacterium]
MALPVTDTDEEGPSRRVTTLYRLRTQYDEYTALSLYGEAHPDKKDAIDEAIGRYGDEEAFKLLIEAIHPGALPPPEKPVAPAAVPPTVGKPIQPPDIAPAERPDVERPPVQPTPVAPRPGEMMPVPGRTGFPEVTLPGPPGGLGAAFAGELARGLRPEPRNIPAAAATFGRGLTLLPKQVGARLVTSMQGHRGATVVNKGWGDRLVESASADLEGFVQKTAKAYGERRIFPGVQITDVAALPANLAYSGTALGAGLAAGVPVSFLPIPGARVAAYGVGGAAAGVVAFNMASYEIMQEFLEAKNEEMQAKKSRDITAAEEKQLKKQFAWKARKYGLWEAIPEAAGGALSIGILMSPLTKVAGKSIASRIVGKMASIYAEEFVTEAVTEMGQMGIRAQVGLPGGREVDWTSPTDWWLALRNIAPQTFLLTTTFAIAGGAPVTTKQVVNKLKQEVGEQHPFYANLEEKVSRPAESIARERQVLASEIERTTQREAVEAGPRGVVPAGRPAEEMPIAVPEVAPEVAPAEAPPVAPPAEVPVVPPEAPPAAPAQPTLVPGVPPPKEPPPAKPLPKPKRRTLSVLPRKKEILGQIDKAIEAAPVRSAISTGRQEQVRITGDEYVSVPILKWPAGVKQTIAFKIDGGAKIQNTKEGLTDFRKRVNATATKMVITQTKVGVPRPIAAKSERMNELLKGVPKGYFSDATIIVKGKPPRGAKMGDRDAAGAPV